MAGAIGGLLGSSGILGGLLDIVGKIFPPLSIVSSLANQLIDTIGGAVKDAVGTLIKESGAPKFLQGMVNSVVDQVLPGQKRETDPAVDGAIRDDQGVQDWFKDFGKELSNSIVESSRKNVERDRSSGGGKTSGGSWLQAIAAAMGEVMGDKAARMVELSTKMADLNAEGKGLTEELKGASKSDKQDIEAEKQDNARAFSQTQSEFQAVSQEFSMLSNTFSTAIKSIGEGLTAMGRKS